MAEISTATTADKPGVRRSKKLSTRVDLTPMVDLGFLLITFFIFTTTMSTPRELPLYMPADGPPSKSPESGSLTVLPLSSDKIFYYHGEMKDALNKKAFGITSYSVKDGIGQVIRDKQLVLDKVKQGGRKNLILMIKPTSESNYKNVVNLLDEVLLNDVKRYAIMDITEEEKKMLQEKNGGL
jgi:biopolymer transport protein ExbD